MPSPTNGKDAPLMNMGESLVVIKLHVMKRVSICCMLTATLV
jgi:hypothetical protein